MSRIVISRVSELASSRVDFCLEHAKHYLTSKMVEEAQANVEFLMGFVLGCGRLEVRTQGAQVLSQKQSVHFWRLIRDRGRRMPLAYLLGTQAFMDFEVRVTSQVLIPRPETEGLVEVAMEIAKTRFKENSIVHILEIGTGSGCVSIALARGIADAALYATDISPSALSLAIRNAQYLGLGDRIRFLRDDLFKPEATSASTSAFADMIVSNPPYVPTAEIKYLSPEVRFEPALALDGGPDGLQALRAIIADAPRRLKKGGWIVLEIGHSQGASVEKILKRDFISVELRDDFQRWPRVVIAQMPF